MARTCLLKGYCSDSKLHMYEFSYEIRGFHIYKQQWTPNLGDTLVCETEDTNSVDANAISVKTNGQIVGHVPIEISSVIKHFLAHSGHVTAHVTGKSRYSIVPDKGQVIPCKYCLKGPAKFVKRVKQLIQMATSDIRGVNLQ